MPIGVGLRHGSRHLIHEIHHAGRGGPFLSVEGVGDRVLRPAQPIPLADVDLGPVRVERERLHGPVSNNLYQVLIVAVDLPGKPDAILAGIPLRMLVKVGIGWSERVEGMWAQVEV